MKINRRSFLTHTAVGATAAYAGLNFGLMPLHKAKADADDAHFFLMVFIQGGFDWSYAVDARPLSMKAAGIHNSYLEVEPTLHTGVNGQTTWIAPSARSLLPWLSRLTIVNGALVSQSFDGHDQNMNVVLSTSPFGGDSFVPMMNTSSVRWRPRPVDVLTLQTLFLATVTNSGRSIPLGRNDAAKLIATLRQNPLHSQQSRLSQFVQSRYSRLGTGRGALAQGARKVEGSFETSHDLSQMMSSIQIPASSGSEMADNAQYLASLFKGGITRSAQMALFPQLTGGGFANVDAHDNGSARTYSEIAESLMSQVADLFSHLANTPFDASRSLLDVTTVMVTSEFARSLKSLFGPFEHTGTEHNGLTNTMLLLGKGIKAGLVVGASDYQTPTEVLSQAHVGPNGVDPQKYRTMARPMDLSNLTVRSDLPLGFVQEDYLNVTHVTNTLLKLFGVPEPLHRPLRSNTPIAPILRGILA